MLYLIQCIPLNYENIDTLPSRIRYSQPVSSLQQWPTLSIAQGTSILSILLLRSSFANIYTKISHSPTESKERWLVMLFTASGLLAFKDALVGFALGLAYFLMMKLQDRVNGWTAPRRNGGESERLLSIVSTSLENRFVILPRGVVSKKDIGARSTRATAACNIAREAAVPDLVRCT